MSNNNDISERTLQWLNQMPSGGKDLDDLRRILMNSSSVMPPTSSQSSLIKDSQPMPAFGVSLPISSKTIESMATQGVNQTEKEPIKSFGITLPTNTIGNVQQAGPQSMKSFGMALPVSTSLETDIAQGAPLCTARNIPSKGRSQMIVSKAENPNVNVQQKKDTTARNQTSITPSDISRKVIDLKRSLGSDQVPSDESSKPKQALQDDGGLSVPLVVSLQSSTETIPQVTSVPCSDPNDPQLMSQYLLKCLDKYGICVIDRFMGEKDGLGILDEVKDLHCSGSLSEAGKLTLKETPTTTGSKDNPDTSNLRGDQITWLNQEDDEFPNIGLLVKRLDKIIGRCDGNLAGHSIGGRTKAMVACYPGHGTRYVRHVDNPNKDGRCVTCIYYLNKDWNQETDGGLLKIYPEKMPNFVANIEPKFDRMLFFWSDRRNPHEVNPAYRTRYAITVWYFDALERLEAKKRHLAEAKWD